jgi:hypothetical protein
MGEKEKLIKISQRALLKIDEKVIFWLICYVNLGLKFDRSGIER